MPGKMMRFYFLMRQIPFSENEARSMRRRINMPTRRFPISFREWKNMTGKITITKTGDTVTASINSNGVISDKSRIIELENGWYAWELNASDFIGDGLADAVDLGLIYHENQVVSGVVYIDWLSVNIIDAK